MLKLLLHFWSCSSQLVWTTKRRNTIWNMEYETGMRVFAQHEIVVINGGMKALIAVESDGQNYYL